MRHRGWLLGTTLVMALAQISALASEPDQTQWRLANFTWLKLVPAESGAAANAHPATFSDEALVAALGPVQATVEGQNIPLFAKDELKGLARPLREALALAKPGEDLILLSTFKRGGGFMEMPVGLTARLFVADGALHLIVHDARLTFMDRYSADRTLPTFVYGSRAAASGVALEAPQATRRRADWLSFPLAPAPAPATAPATPAPAPATAVPPVAAPPKPAATAAPATTPAARDEAFYEAQAQRLRALKKLRDENLLSEAEYQEKRDAILKTL
ncbi:MAG: SHOCT domain-containing protein [Holophagaceae bacterium]|nr:SHOCT domain-containing protein [Holophagaceae bacterium]